MHAGLQYVRFGDQYRHRGNQSSTRSHARGRWRAAGVCARACVRACVVVVVVVVVVVRAGGRIGWTDWTCRDGRERCGCAPVQVGLPVRQHHGDARHTLRQRARTTLLVLEHATRLTTPIDRCRFGYQVTGCRLTGNGYQVTGCRACSKRSAAASSMYSVSLVCTYDASHPHTGVSYTHVDGVDGPRPCRPRGPQATSRRTTTPLMRAATLARAG